MALKAEFIRHLPPGTCAWGMNPSNSLFYTTASDGLRHPCDTPGIEPQEFLLAVMRDPTIPMDFRIWGMKSVMEAYPEWRPTYEDYLMASSMSPKEFTVQ